MNEIIQKQDQKLTTVIYKAPALITLYVASQVAKGHLEHSEEKSAKIYLSILCNQGPEDLLDYFKEVKQTFEQDLKGLNEELPTDSEMRKKEIEQRLKPVKKFISQLPSSQGIVFKDTLLSFIIHSRNANEDMLLSVILPFIADDLMKLEDERLRRIL